MKTIDRFKGEFEFLSNFYKCKMLEGYPTLEHAFQAYKTNDCNDREKIKNLETPGKAKRYGRKVTLRPFYELKKNNIMQKLLTLKFFRNEDLKKLLLDTGDSLIIEGNNWHDNYWGNCICEKCKNIKGQNVLGKQLMKVRCNLKNSIGGLL